MTFSPQKFNGKYRIASNRLKEWDYGTPGYYFVTICTQNRVRWFGEVKGDRMIVSLVGEIVVQELQITAHIRTNVSVDEWVVMPNHIHAIIVIEEMSGAHVETPRRGVSTKINWRPGTLGAIINQYKAICTKRIHASGCVDFAWQARFYDHIIQDEKSLENIRTYIQRNPIKWTEDEYFSDI
jgi:REP element-mobilizing transposase RayT